MNKIALIVDDSRVSRLMLGSLLKAEDPEWQVVEAANGLEALSKAAKETLVAAAVIVATDNAPSA